MLVECPILRYDYGMDQVLRDRREVHPDLSDPQFSSFLSLLRDALLHDRCNFRVLLSQAFDR